MKKHNLLTIGIILLSALFTLTVTISVTIMYNGFTEDTLQRISGFLVCCFVFTVCYAVIKEYLQDINDGKYKK